jgi:hypothetical protein
MLAVMEARVNPSFMGFEGTPGGWGESALTLNSGAGLSAQAVEEVEMLENNLFVKNADDELIHKFVTSLCEAQIGHIYLALQDLERKASLHGDQADLFSGPKVEEVELILLVFGLGDPILSFDLIMELGATPQGHLQLSADQWRRIIGRCAPEQCRFVYRLVGQTQGAAAQCLAFDAMNEYVVGGVV